MRKVLLVIGAALALSGCDQIQDLIGMDTNDNRTAASNRTRGAPADDALISNLQPIGQPGPGQDQGGGEGPPSDGGAQPPQMPPPQDGATGTFDPSMLVGRWGDNGNCSQVIEFFANGTFRAANGGTGNWRIAGNRLTMSGGSRSITMTLIEVTPRRVRVRDPNGSMGESIRC